MKQTFKKPWFAKTIILVLFVFIFFLNFVALQLPLDVSPAESLWSLATNASTGTARIYPLVLQLAFYVSIFAVALSVFDLAAKKNAGNFIGVFYYLVFAIAIIVYQPLYHTLKTSIIAMEIISVILSVICFALAVRAKKLSKLDAPTVAPLTLKSNRLAFGILVVDIASLLLLLFSLLFIPLYTVSNGSTSQTCIFATALFSKSAALEDSIYALVNMALVIFCALYFVFSLSSFFSDKKDFVAKSKNFMVILLSVSMEFFLLGYIIQFVYSIQSFTASSISYILFFAMMAMTLVYAILKGKFDEANIPPEAKKKPVKPLKKAAPLIFVLIFTVLTFCSIFLNVIKIHFTSGGYTEDLAVTGLKLLQDYPSLGSGYQAVAFAIMVMLICSGSGLFLVLVSYFSHYKHYETLAKVVAYVNIFLVFIFGVSGLYFTVAAEITKESTKNVIEYYGYTYSDDMTYRIHTDVLYILLADLVVLGAMIWRRALDGNKTEFELPDGLLGGGAGTGAASAGANEETNAVGFDPCPAFTELDSKAKDFKIDLEKRKMSIAPAGTLSDLVKFVVEYARDSRLHLSYREEDIATFISGLGACRLTILQGMSGTGKTSLPKIFSEAIDGNCDIIEVESSWKDKNELLGYYNEFSRTYTPKKFTQALYKAALNPEIPTFIVLDEMNLSRIEYYFSDFLSLMENEENKREIKLINIKLSVKEEDGSVKQYGALTDGHTLKVPPNIWFIGTANRDESTFVISDKVYDRAHTMNFNKRAPKVRDFDEPIPQKFYTYDMIAGLLKEAKEKGKFDAENDETIKKVEALLAPFNISFGNRILLQMENFVDIYEQCFPDRDVRAEAVETILLSKVVAKLEVKTIDDKEGLVKDFEDLNLHRCAEFISKLNED